MSGRRHQLAQQRGRILVSLAGRAVDVRDATQRLVERRASLAGLRVETRAALNEEAGDDLFGRTPARNPLVES